MMSSNRMRLMAGGLLVLVWSAMLPLATASPRTDPIIKKAARHYLNLDYEKALRTLDLAIREPENRNPQLALIYRWQGLCHGALGDQHAAIEAFRRWLTLEPKAALGPRQSPRIRAIFDRARQSRANQLAIKWTAKEPAGTSENTFNFEVHDPLGMAAHLRVWHRVEPAQAYVRHELNLRAAKAPEVTLRVQRPEKPAIPVLLWYARLENDYGGHLRQLGGPQRPKRQAFLAAPENETAAKSASTVLEAASLSEAWYKTWWVWTIVGAVVVAGTVTAIAAATTRGSDSSHVDLGISVRVENP